MTMTWKTALLRRLSATLFTVVSALPMSGLQAADYKIDTQGAHAFVQFKIKHLGYSWLWGRFNNFKGDFSFDENKPDATKVNVEINMSSLDTNHAERDKHLKGKDFFDVEKFPTTTFKSTSVTVNADKSATLKGDLTLKGITKSIDIPVTAIGGGADPWGGYRQGFEGHTTLKLKDFGINYDLGPATQEAEVLLSIEGIRQ